MAYIWYGAFFFNLILALVIVFFQRRDPKTVWAWLLVLYFLPLVGFVLYLFLGRNFYCERKFKNKMIEDMRVVEAGKQEEMIILNDFTVSDKVDKDYVNLVRLNLHTGSCFYTENNVVDIFTDGNRKFDALIEAIERAEKFVFLQYYIIREDIVFERICKCLKKRAAAGIKVYVLADGVGSRKIPGRRWKELEAAGVRVNLFFPAIAKKIDLRINYRNHRKIVVIDGVVGFMGGFNIGKEYLGIDKKYGYWRDTHLKIEGDAVMELMLKFVQDWNYAAETEKESLDYKNFDILTRKYNAGNIEQDMRQGNGKMNVPEKSVGLQIISSGPDIKNEQIRDNFLYMIYHARKNIYIQSPYFIPDEAVFCALKMAAQRDVEVKIMIPCKPDHPFVYWATLSFIGDLLRCGARCYVYQNGFLHAKSIMTDGIVSSVGTANMDVRSFKLNFEVNAMIYDRGVTGELEQIFLKDIGKSSELTLYDYRQRSFGVRVKEQVSRLLSPLL